MAAPGPGAEPGRLVAQALSAGDPTGWFEPLYAAAEQGAAIVPWDRGGAPHWLLTTWAERTALAGGGRRALVVGCGLGADAEYIAGRGFAVLAFDISASAINRPRANWWIIFTHWSYALCVRTCPGASPRRISPKRCF